MELFFSFIIAMFITMMLIPFLMRSAQRLQFVDIPDDTRKIHVNAIPRVGGVAMVVGAMIPILMWTMPAREIQGLLLGMAILVIFGLWDDRKDLDYRIKFLGQLLAALVVILYGGVRIEHFPFVSADTIPYIVSVIITVIAMLGITNAINLADGLDGLAGGTTLLSLGIITILAYIVDNQIVMLITLSLIGSILGFLRFNTYPARVFMGDCGSQFLGFCLGVLVLLLTQKESSALSLALPLLLLGLPILDTLLVIGQRLYEGRSPFKADNSHIHHKLLSLGFDHYEAVFMIYAVQACLVVSAYFLRYESDMMIILLFFLLCIFVMACFWIAAIKGWRFHQKKTHEVTVFAWKIKELHFSGQLSTWAFFFVLITIPFYLLSGILVTQNVSIDIGILALCLLAILIVMYSRRSSDQFTWMERASAYIISTLVIYHVHMVPGNPERNFEIYSHIYFVMLALAVVIGFSFSKEKAFKLTPLDFIVVFVAFTVPNLPVLNFIGAPLGEGIAKMIVLFYGFELLLTNAMRHHDIVRMIMYFALGLMGIKGFI